MIRFIMAATALLAAVAVEAQTGPAQTVATAAAGPGSLPVPTDKSRRVCRNITVTGSRFGTRICRSEADWASDEDRTQRRMQDVERYGSHKDGEINGYDAIH